MFIILEQKIMDFFGRLQGAKVLNALNTSFTKILAQFFYSRSRKLLQFFVSSLDFVGF